MSSMNKLTVLNITASTGKMIFAYTMAVVVVPLLAYYLMIIRFIKKHEAMKHKSNP